MDICMKLHKVFRAGRFFWDKWLWVTYCIIRLYVLIQFAWQITTITPTKVILEICLNIGAGSSKPAATNQVKKLTVPANSLSASPLIFWAPLFDTFNIYIYIYIYIYGILKNNWYICMIYSPDNKLIWRGILPYIQSDRLTPHSANQPIGMHHSIVRSST